MKLQDRLRQEAELHWHGQRACVPGLLHEAANTLDRLESSVCSWQQAAHAKQAHIDRLMLEFCPGEMTESQREEWARNQTPQARP